MAISESKQSCDGAPKSTDGEDDMDIKSASEKILKGDISGVVSDVKSTIERSLSLIGVIIVTVAASIGSGLFVLPSFAAAVMGPGIWLAFLVAGIVFFLLLLCFRYR